MKEREKPIQTMPEGIWESSRPGQEGYHSAGSGVSGANGAWDGLGNSTDGSAGPQGDGAGSPGDKRSGTATYAGVMDAGMQNIANIPADPSLTMDWQGNGYPGQPKSRTASDNS